jgi:hypothetical protein
MAKKTPKRKTKPSVDDGEQQDIEGTRAYNAKCEQPVAKYLEALRQRMAWQAEENNLRVVAMDAMVDADVMVYYLKTGASLKRVDKGEKLEATFPKDEDDKAVKPDLQVKITKIKVGK